MARKQKTIHYLYKTTCLVTGRYYIGIHSTNNLDDGYMGSGKRLRYSLRKHGIDNHTKEIIEFFETRESLVEAEIKIVTSELVNQPKGIGCENSQYGTCWITNEIENKKIMKGDLIPEGWRLGRKIR